MESGFNAPYNVLQGQFIAGTRDFKLSAPIVFTSAKYSNFVHRFDKSSQYFPKLEENTTMEWYAPENTVIDGASIPKFLWSVVGAPYSGKYRLSAAVHDYYCKVKTRPCKKVHALFAEMIECEGVTGWRLWAMSRAVKYFGPKW